MQRRSTGLLLAVLAIAACKGVDRLLEGVPEPTSSRLAVALQSSSITMARGTEQTFTATVTRIGDFTGQVAVSIDGLPDGVTATLGAASTTGAATTTPITVRATAAAQLGSFIVQVRGHADQLPDGSQTLVLVVTEQPAYALTLALPAVTIARGGIARVGAKLTRTNFASGVTLSVQSVSGISGVFNATPTTGDTATATLTVDANASPGTYNVTVRGTAEGVSERTATVAVTVTTDAVQVIAPPEVSAQQGSSLTAEVIVNRPGFSGTLTLSAENLPTGVSASFQPGTNPATATMTLIVAATVTPGPYSIIVRARGAGVADATTQVALIVISSRIDLSLNPQTVSVLQGASTSSSLTIARTNFTGALALAVEGAPAGVTITAQPTTVTGTTATIGVAAAATAVAGDYTVTLRATTVGAAFGPSQAITLGVTVRAVPAGTGNVFLDWSACTPPAWVAYQDGTGLWTQALPTSGVFRFSINSTRGAFAFADADGVQVRFMTRAELIVKPFTMCAVAPPTKIVYGSAIHRGALEQFTWRLGGASAISTQAAPDFSLVGVSEGVHDLVGWGTSALSGLRAIIRRDQNIENGGTLEVLDMASTESFAVLRPTLTTTGVLNGDNVSHAMNYLTTAACTANLLYTAVGSFTTMFGIPESVQRTSDFHMLTVTAATATTSRSSTMVFHTLSGNRSQALPPLPATTVSTALGGASYKRLQVFLPSIATQYNQSVTLRYVDAAKAMVVSATSAYIGATTVTLTMPDFSAVAGWQPSFAIAAAQTGRWTATLDGTRTSDPLCTENAGTYLATVTGVF